MRLLTVIATVAFVSVAAAGRNNAIAAADQRQTTMRFAEMDANRDGMITRDEWRGSDRSFAVHDWNGDGRLSGNEVRIGSTWPSRAGSPEEFNDWSQARFNWLDTNRDNRVTRAEWRYDREDFFRVDRNGDGVITWREFQVGTDDDDRGDRFADLDMNNNNRIERNEWHASQSTFTWLDRNRDGMLSRNEVAGSDEVWGNAGNAGTALGTRPQPPRTVMVSARQQWTDTGLDVRVGDRITVSPSGIIRYAPSQGDRVDPAGGANNATAGAPRPDLPIGALIGRVGNGQPFLIGRGLEAMRIAADGRLYLGTNDDILSDNDGQFRAVVTVTRRGVQ
jgi:Ca2+-binding EF-hand superfamily protein